MNGINNMLSLENGPLISIVIPVYNTEKYMQRCVESILNQTYRNLEIILVDDCSTDDSPIMIEEYVNQDNRIKTIKHETNRGLFQARITGSQLATGEYIAFVDSDDYVSVDWFRLLLRKAEEEKCDITVGEWCFDNDGKSKTYLNLDPFRIKNYLLKDNEILDAFMEQEGQCFSWTVVWNKLYRKQLWDKCLSDFIAFSHQHGHMLMWEDIAFSSNLWIHASKVCNAHGGLYFYFQHNGASTAKNNSKKRNLKYIADASSAMQFMRDMLKKYGRISDESKHFDKWNENAASLIYRELVLNNGLKQYKKIIETSFGITINDVKNNDFFYRITSPIHESFFWKESLKKRLVSEEIKIVSFDIFDTLIQRPFFEPTDLFALLSGIYNKSHASYIDFARIRISAEQSVREMARISVPRVEEITIDQIYDEINATTVISAEDLNELKEKEKEMEVNFCTTRIGGKELYELAVEANKTVIICSDMYLGQEVVEKILRNNGYNYYAKLYLSSTYMCTKSSGSLYRFIQNDLKFKNTNEIIHIGDNWNSDVEKSQNSGWKSEHLCKASDLLKNQNPGIYSGCGYNNALIWNTRQQDFAEVERSFSGIRLAAGITANHLFGDPFVSINPNSDFNANPETIGYWTLGWHLLALSDWLIQQAKERDIETIHFVARDGYLVKQAFDIMNNGCVKSNYIRLSRRALLLADIDVPEDLYSLSKKINIYHCTPKKMALYLEPLIPKMNSQDISNVLEQHHFDENRKFQTYREFAICLKLFIDEIIDFSCIRRYKEELKEYFSKQIQPGDYIFDVGYSGRPEAALSNILGFPVGSLYIHVNSEIAKLRQRKYNCENTCFYSTKPCVTGVIREHLLMELGPSTIGYKKINGKLQPEFEKYTPEYTSSIVTQFIQEAAIRFIQDYHKIFKDYRDIICLPHEAMSAPLEYYLHYSKNVDREILSSLNFEDSLNEGKEFNAVQFWNRDIETHGLLEHTTNVGVSCIFDDLYSDGLFVKLYRFLNKNFPKGSRRRNCLKKIGSIFLH